MPEFGALSPSVLRNDIIVFPFSCLVELLRHIDLYFPDRAASGFTITNLWPDSLTIIPACAHRLRKSLVFMVPVSSRSVSELFFIHQAIFRTTSSSDSPCRADGNVSSVIATIKLNTSSSETLLLKQRPLRWREVSKTTSAVRLFPLWKA